jgi:hypothetical protein
MSRRELSFALLLQPWTDFAASSRRLLEQRMFSVCQQIVEHTAIAKASSSSNHALTRRPCLSMRLSGQPRRSMYCLAPSQSNRHDSLLNVTVSAASDLLNTSSIFRQTLRTGYGHVSCPAPVLLPRASLWQESVYHASCLVSHDLWSYILRLDGCDLHRRFLCRTLFCCTSVTAGL